MVVQGELIRRSHEMPGLVGVNLRASACLHQGDRKYMEDEFVVAYQRTPDKKDIEYSFFGIFDGHGGKEAAHYAKDHLMDNIVSQKTFWSDDDDDVRAAIREGFIQTHMAMWKELDQWPRTASGWPSTSGTTASVAFIRKQKIYIGHVGDSGICLGYAHPSNEHGWWGQLLTRDHKPESNQEKSRIMRCGGKVVSKAGVPRVVWNRPKRGHKGPVRRSTPMDEIPFLAVARSLGDLWSYNPINNQFVVSPVPDILVKPIDINVHRCLIFGTDGLWNVLSPHTAVNTAYCTEKNNESHYLGLKMPCGNQRNWVNPSRSVVRAALDRYSRCNLRADNTSAIVVFLDPPGRPKREVLLLRKGLSLNKTPEHPTSISVPASSSSSANSNFNVHLRLYNIDKTKTKSSDIPSPGVLWIKERIPEKMSDNSVGPSDSELSDSSEFDSPGPNMLRLQQLLATSDVGEQAATPGTSEEAAGRSENLKQSPVLRASAYSDTCGLPSSLLAAGSGSPYHQSPQLWRPATRPTAASKLVGKSSSSVSSVSVSRKSHTLDHDKLAEAGKLKTGSSAPSTVSQTAECPVLRKTLKRELEEGESAGASNSKRVAITNENAEGSASTGGSVAVCRMHKCSHEQASQSVSGCACSVNNVSSPKSLKVRALGQTVHVDKTSVDPIQIPVISSSTIEATKTTNSVEDTLTTLPSSVLRRPPSLLSTKLKPKLKRSCVTKPTDAHVNRQTRSKISMPCPSLQKAAVVGRTATPMNNNSWGEVVTKSVSGNRASNRLTGAETSNELQQLTAGRLSADSGLPGGEPLVSRVLKSVNRGSICESSKSSPGGVQKHLVLKIESEKCSTLHTFSKCPKALKCKKRQTSSMLTHSGELATSCKKKLVKMHLRSDKSMVTRSQEKIGRIPRSK